MNSLYWWGLHLCASGFTDAVRAVSQELEGREAWSLNAAAWCARGLPWKQAARLVERREQLNLEAQAHRAALLGVTFISWQDEAWSHVQPFAEAPLALSCIGRVELLKEPLVAMVGSRQATPYGLDVAWRLARGWAQEGLVVVSGMARGIDATAHDAASSRTIAVLGCGVDTLYPRELANLRQRLVEEALLVSDYPLGARPLAHHFPYRNRIISGLAEAVVVVEGTRRSGSLHTVDWALSQGREVYAVPGPITSRQSELPNRLLQMGAQVCIDGESVRTAVQSSWSSRLGLTPVMVGAVAEAPGRWGPEAQAILQVVGSEPLPLGAIAEQCGLALPTVLAEVVDLELRGALLRTPEGRYRRG